MNGFDRRTAGELGRASAPLLIALGVVVWLLHQVASGGYLDAATVPWVRESHLPAMAVHCILLFGTVVTIFIGTVLFLIAVQDESPRLRSNYAHRCGRGAVAATIASLVLCVVWMFAIWLPDVRAVVVSILGEWVHEWLALITFGLFIAVDLLFVLAARHELRLLAEGKQPAADGNKEKLKALDELSLDSLRFIDIPVVVGLVMILLLLLHLHHDRYLSSETVGETGGHQHRRLEDFVHGLAAGAICMHLTFSQLIFAILKSREAWKGRRSGEEIVTKRNTPVRLLVAGALATIAVVWIAFAGRRPGPLTITVLGEDSSNLQAIERLQQTNPFSPDVVVSFVKNKFEEAQNKADQDFAAHEGKFDVVLQYNFALANYVRHGYVNTLSDVQQLLPHVALDGLADDIFDSAWKEVGFYPRRSGEAPEAIGYPFAANTMLLVYNRRLFEDPEHKKEYRKRFHEELEPPREWAQFRNIAEYFTMPDRHLNGVALQGGADGWLYYEWCNFAFGFGGGVMEKKRGWEGDQSTPITIDSPATVDATRFYLALKPWNGSPDYFSTGAVEQREIMKTGRVAMAIMWSDYLYPLVADERTRAMWGFAPIPGKRSMLAGGIYYLNKSSRHQREAASFVLNLMKRDNQIWLARQGLCSPLKSVYEDSAVKALPYTSALRESLDRGVYMLEGGPDASAISTIITSWLQKAWRGEVDPEKALKEAHKEIEAKRDDLARFQAP